MDQSQNFLIGKSIKEIPRISENIGIKHSKTKNSFIKSKEQLKNLKTSKGTYSCPVLTYANMLKRHQKSSAPVPLKGYSHEILEFWFFP